MTYDAWSYLKEYHPHMVHYLLVFLLPQLELVVFLLQEFLGLPLLLEPLLQQGLQADFLFPTSVKLLPGYVQPFSQGIYLYLELTLLLLTAPLEDKAKGTASWLYLNRKNYIFGSVMKYNPNYGDKLTWLFILLLHALYWQLLLFLNPSAFCVPTMVCLFPNPFLHLSLVIIPFILPTSILNCFTSTLHTSTPLLCQN